MSGEPPPPKPPRPPKKGGKLELKKWEIGLIAVALLTLSAGGFVYFTGFPIGKYLFGWIEDTDGRQIATLVRMTGGVRRQKQGDPDFRDIAMSAALFNEDTIITAPDSTARIEFTDGSYIEMAPSTMIRLSFGGEFSLGGVIRATSVQVLSGNVSGESKSENFSVQHGAEKVALQPPPKPKPSPSPSRSPSPSPSPSPSETPKLVLVYPKNGSHLAVPNGSQVAELPLTFNWQMTPQPPALQFKLIQRSPKPVVLFKKTVAMKSPIAQLPLALKRPGAYRWEIATPAVLTDPTKPAGPTNPEKTPEVLLDGSNFILDNEYEAIQLNDPTVSGSRAATSQLRGKVIKDFDLTFSWEPYAEMKKYELSFYLRPDAKAIWSRSIDGTNYVMNKGKVFSGQIYYQVHARTPNGFIVRSPVKGFGFNFTSPVPKIPADNSEFSKSELMKGDNQILFTWEKTNFTSEYEVELSSDPSLESVVARQRTGENFYVLKDPKVGVYYWRVQSFTGNEKQSQPSRVVKFTVGQ